MAGLGSLIPKLSAGSGSGFSPRDMPMQDKLLMLASILKGDNDAAMKIPLMAQAREQMAKQDAATQDLAQFASGVPIPQRPKAVAYDPSAAAPAEGTMGLAPRISVPQTQLPARSPAADAMGGPVTARSALPMLAKLAATGGDPSKWVSMLQAAQPEVAYERGVRYDKHDPSTAPSEITDLDKGQVRLYDAGGRFMGVKNADGYVQSVTDLESAKSNAQERSKARYDIVSVPLSNGRTVSLPRLSAVERLSGQGGGAPSGPPASGGEPGGGFAGASGAAGGEFGVAPSAAETEADKKRAGAQADAQISLPQSVQDADQALALIGQIKANPALKDRTGWKSLLPALPGSPGAAFDSEDDQLRGKLFMQAYAGLKGGGQITEVEGKKATQAIARLSRSQSAADYGDALDELGQVIQAGRDRAANQAHRTDLAPSAASGGRLRSVPLEDRLAEARRRGLIK